VLCAAYAYLNWILRSGRARPRALSAWASPERRLRD
jgi:hypothetical protein